METWGYVLLIAAALVIGYLVQFAYQQKFGLTGLLAAVGAAVGGFVASEYLGGLSDWGTEFYGLRVFPAVIAGLIVAVFVEFAARTLAPSES